MEDCLLAPVLVCQVDGKIIGRSSKIGHDPQRFGIVGDGFIHFPLIRQCVSKAVVRFRIVRVDLQSSLKF